ncbi:MAG TPA: lipopolysaccharide biosynthesis protein [Longimicrobium sp.]|nr:lipopolysaccharide biosynthesis protein [Longimicrobium sp.]
MQERESPLPAAAGEPLDPPGPRAAAPAALGAHAARGVRWSYLSALANVVLQIGLASVMARLVGPQAYGLVAVGTVALRFASYFSDLGIGSALVQKRELERAEIRAAFASSLGVGALMYALTFLAAPLAAAFFRMPDLTAVLRVLGLTVLVGAVGSTAQNLLRREMRFRALAVIDLVSFAVGYGVVGIGLALRGAGVWALVGSALTQAVLGRVLCFAAVRHPLALSFRWSTVRPLYAFGSRVSLLGLMEFVGVNLDTLVIGRWAGPVALGFYNRGNMLAALPMMQFTDAVARVLLPTFGRLQDERERLRGGYLVSIALIASVVIPLACGLAAASRELVLVVLGPSWIVAAGVMPFLAVAVCMEMLARFGAVLLEATARLNLKLAIQAGYMVLLVALFTAAARLGLAARFGVAAYAAAWMCAMTVYHVAYSVALSRVLGIGWREWGRVYGGAVLTGIVAGGAIHALSRLGSAARMGAGWVLAAQIVAGATVLLLSLLVGPQRSARRLIAHRFSHLIGSAPRSALATRLVAYAAR